MHPIHRRMNYSGRSFADVDDIIMQTKIVLRLYRPVAWALDERQNDLHRRLLDNGWNCADTGVTRLTFFAPEIDQQEFEARVARLLENKLMVAFIEKSINHLARFPDYGGIYHDIITLQYTAQNPVGESEMLDRLPMERSTFYRRKKEALLLLGVCLFGFAGGEYYTYPEAGSVGLMIS